MPEPTTLALSILFSTVGFAIFWYGRKQRRAPHLVGGLLLAAFPYFVSSPIVMLVVGGVLLAALIAGVKLGL